VEGLFDDGFGAKSVVSKNREYRDGFLDHVE